MTDTDTKALRERMASRREDGYVYTSDVSIDEVEALLDELDRLRAENEGYPGIAHDLEKLRAENERLRGVATAWLAFSSDVQASDAAGDDWLESLRARTSAALEGK